MKLIPWIVALCNRNWQKKLDTIIAEVEAQEEPKLVDGELNLNMDVINQQPTHLSYKFKARAKRKRKPKHKPYPKPTRTHRRMNGT